MEVLAKITFNPSDGDPEELVVRLPKSRLEEFQGLIGTDDWKQSEMVLWIPMRHSDGSFKERMFRLARISKAELIENS